MALATWAWQLRCGAPWVPEYPHCHQMMTQTLSKASGSFPKGQTFKIEQSPNPPSPHHRKKVGTWFGGVGRAKIQKKIWGIILSFKMMN